MVKLKAIHFFLLLAVINLKVESNNNTARSYEIGVVLKVDLVDSVVLEKCISMAISDFYHLHPYHRTKLRLRSTPQTGNNLKLIYLFSIVMGIQTSYSGAYNWKKK